MAAVSSSSPVHVRTSFSGPARTAVYSIQPPITVSNAKRQTPRSVSDHNISPSNKPRPARPSTRDSTIEAIAKFKPTPRDVISGIAPHVFDERRRRRSQKRASRRSWCEANGLVHVQNQKCSSPLRRTAVLSLEEHSIYLEHSGSKLSLSSEPLDVTPPSIAVTASGAPSRPPSLIAVQTPEENHVQRPVPITVLNTQPIKGLDRSAKRSQFRIDSDMLKTLIVKCRFSRFRSIH